ncbi:hypothetical protein BDR26DRAFT_856323, partial [Obelidium mucronatum]
MANNELAARAKILTKEKLLKLKKATGAMPALLAQTPNHTQRCGNSSFKTRRTPLGPYSGSGRLPDCGDCERQQTVTSGNCSSPLGGSNRFFFTPDNSKTVETLWAILEELLGVSAASISSLLSYFVKQFMAIDLYKLNGDNLVALNLITDVSDVGNSQRTGPQLFMHNDFLTSATEFLKLSDTTRVQHVIDLIAVNQRDLIFEGQSGRMYTDFLDVFNYDGDDAAKLDNREIMVEGHNCFYSAMAHRLQG